MQKNITKNNKGADRALFLHYTATKNIILKDYLLELGLSKRFIRKVKMFGKMYVNDELAKNYYMLKPNDQICLEYYESNEDILTTYDKLDIVYIDSYFMIIFKPIDIAIQPNKKHYEYNLLNAIKGYFKLNNINGIPHLINRLDYQTSGLVIVSFNGVIHNEFSKINITKKYLLITEKNDLSSGIIDLKIKREDPPSIKRYVSDDGVSSITKYRKILDTSISLMEATLLTGRTHQLRVHFSHLGYPIIGDKIYGVSDNRLYLTCYSLEFFHPVTKELVSIKKIDQDFNEKLQIKIEKCLD